MFYVNDEGEISSMPSSWTDVLPAEPFIVIAAGRSCFRTEDLLEMVQLLKHMAKSK